MAIPALLLTLALAVTPAEVARIPELIGRGELASAELEIARHFAEKRPPLVDYWLGAIRLEQERLGEAEALFRSALARRTDRAAWHHALASALARQGRATAALAALEAALRLEPGRTRLYFDRAMCFQGLGDPAAAESALRWTLELEPNHARASFELGKLLFSAGRAAEALPLLERAQELLPAELDVSYHLALVLVEANAEGRARALFAEIIESAPVHAGALYGLARLEQAAGRKESATSLFERQRAALKVQEELENGLTFLALQPTDTTVRRRVVELLLDFGRLAEARDQFEVLRAQGVTDVELESRLGSMPRAEVELEPR